MVLIYLKIDGYEWYSIGMIRYDIEYPGTVKLWGFPGQNIGTVKGILGHLH